MLRSLCAIALVLVVPAAGDEAQHPAWDYGEHGPSHWAELDDAWWLCGEGYHQSPIDLAGWETGNGDAWRSDYQPTAMRIEHKEHVVDIIDNGHTIQITYDEGSTLTIDGKPYDLKQFHFHAPSEHTVEGEHYPVEMHLVHASKDGMLAVAGVFFAEGPHHEAYEALIENLPGKPGDQAHFEDVLLDVDAFFPDADAAFFYAGSLTTPPCTEGVSWLVVREPVLMSAGQIEEFASRLDGNNRPVQARNGRRITAERVE